MTVIHETLWYLIIKFFKVVLQFKCHWTALYRLKSNTQHVSYSYAHVRSRVQVLIATFPSPNQDAARRTHFPFRKRRASSSEGPHLAVHTYISLSLSPCANGTSKNPSFTASRARTRACTPRARTHRDKEAQLIPCKQKFIFAAAKFNDQHVWPTVCCMRPPVAKPPSDFLARRSIPSLSLYSHSRFIRARRDIYTGGGFVRVYTHTHTARVETRKDEWLLLRSLHTCILARFRSTCWNFHGWRSLHARAAGGEYVCIVCACTSYRVTRLVRAIDSVRKLRSLKWDAYTGLCKHVGRWLLYRTPQGYVQVTDFHVITVKHCFIKFNRIFIAFR